MSLNRWGKEKLPQITSTPKSRVRPFNASENLSLSSVLCSEGSQRNSDLSEVSWDIEPSQPRTRLNFPASSSSNVSLVSSLTDDYEAILSTIKFKQNGRHWKAIKPRNTESLYYKIIMFPRNAKQISQSVLKLFKEDPQTCLKELFTFFVNVTGFQNVPFDQFFGSENPNFKKIIKELENFNRKNDHLEDFHKLFVLSASNQTVLHHIVITNFINNLILDAYKGNILFEKEFSFIIMDFVRHMALTDRLRNVRHFGVIIVCSMLTALVKLPDEKKTNTNKLNDMLQYLFVVVYKNSVLTDPKSWILKERCAHDLSIWIQMKPKIFLSNFDGIQKVLFNLLIDESNYVRIASLRTSSNILKCNKIAKFFAPFAESLLAIIAGRFADIDKDVTCLALHTFNEAKDLYFNYISKEDKHFFTLMLHKDYDIGSLAAKNTYTILKGHKQSPEAVIYRLAKFTLSGSNKEVLTYTSLLVESCLSHIPEIKDWKLLFKILTLGRTTSLLSSVAEITFESIYQVVNGQGTKIRIYANKSAKPCHKEEYLPIIEEFIPVVNTLLLQFKENPSILKKVLSTILLLNINKNNLSNHIEVGSSIFHELICLYSVNEDYEVLEEIVKVLEFFKVEWYYLEDVFSPGILQLSNDLCEQLIELLRKGYSLTMQERHTLELTSARVSIMFRHFDLTSSMQINWSTILKAELTNNHSKNMMLCLQWYLIWSIRNLYGNSENQFEVQNKAQQYSEIISLFFSFCFETLMDISKKHSHPTIFLCVCELHRRVFDFLKDKKDPVLYSSLKLKKFTDEHELAIIEDFLDRYVFQGKKSHLLERQKCFARTVELWYIGVLPRYLFCYLLQYYESHNIEFRDLFLHPLHNLSKTGNLVSILVSTLTMFYKKILEKHVICKEDDSCRQLAALSVAFQALDEMKTSKNCSLLLVSAINFYAQSQVSGDFLFFLSGFVKKLNREDVETVFSVYGQASQSQTTKKDMELEFVRVLLKAKSNKKK